MQDKFAHFNPQVSMDTREAMHKIFNGLCESFLGGDDFELTGDIHKGLIFGTPQPGFIPFQAGGFEAIAYGVASTDPYYAITPNQLSFNERLEQEAIDDFVEEYRDALDKLGYTGDNLFDILRDNPLSNELAECEICSLDDAAPLLRLSLWLHARVVYAQFSVGYVDAPYYRDHNDEVIKTLEMEEEDCHNTHKVTRIIRAQFKDAMRQLWKEGKTDEA